MRIASPRSVLPKQMAAAPRFSAAPQKVFQEGAQLRIDLEKLRQFANQGNRLFVSPDGLTVIMNQKLSSPFFVFDKEPVVTIEKVAQELDTLLIFISNSQGKALVKGYEDLLLELLHPIQN